MSTPHMNRYFHWCADCWDWLCDCWHCVEPLTIKRQPVKDVTASSAGIATGCHIRRSAGTIPSA